VAGAAWLRRALAGADWRRAGHALESFTHREPRVQNGNGRVRFGAFEVNLQAGEVRRSGSRLKLQEQPFKVLQILLEHPGELVTREELRSRIWPAESFGDFDHAVNVAVGKLRTALGDSAANPSIVETVPRRGYRFVAALDETAVAGAPAGATPLATAQAAPPAGAAPLATPAGAPRFATVLAAPPAGASPLATALAAPPAGASPLATALAAPPAGASLFAPPLAVQPAGAAPPPAAATAASSGRRRALRLALAAGGAALLVGLGALLGRGTAPALQAPDFQRLTARRGTVYAARFTPGGRNVIYAAAWDGAPIEIFSTDPAYSGTQSLGLPSTQLLSVSSSGAMAVLQPAERRFMLTVRGTLGQVPMAGGAPRQLAENVDWADWAPDGTTLAVVREAAGRQRLEYPLGHVLVETTGWISHPRVSPRGDQVAYLDHPTVPDDRGGVAVVDRAGRRRALSPGWESEEGLAWSPDGREVWFSAARAGLERRIYTVDLAGRQQLRLRAPGGLTLQDIAPDGRLLLTRDDQRLGMMAMARGADRERDLSWRDWSVPEDLSADGGTLLFDEQGADSGPTYTVAVRDLRGSPPVPLGEGLAGGLSPDGRWATATRANAQIVLLPTGAGAARALAAGGIEKYWDCARWLPDGRRLLFAANEAGHGVRCFVQDVAGGRPRAVTPEGVSLCLASRDGRVVAGGDVAGGGVRLYPIDGGEPRLIPGLLPGESFVWTADPRFLYVYHPRRMPVRVFRLNVATGERQLFRELNPPDPAGLGDITQVLFSTDGQVYVYRTTRLLSDLYLVDGVEGVQGRQGLAAPRS
jgi:DNA-binding winged helix-turn-helix (wHTH) protein/dipeptidyl aminopeptidase/acylaminoacyl peptidase